MNMTIYKTIYLNYSILFQKNCIKPTRNSALTNVPPVIQCQATKSEKLKKITDRMSYVHKHTYFIVAWIREGEEGGKGAMKN